MLFDFPRGGEHGTRAPLLSSITLTMRTTINARRGKRSAREAGGMMDGRAHGMIVSRGLTSWRSTVGVLMIFSTGDPNLDERRYGGRGRSYRICRRRKIARRLMTSFGIRHTGRVVSPKRREGNL